MANKSKAAPSQVGGTHMRTTAFLVILEHDYDRFDKDAAGSIKRSLELVKGVAEAIDTQKIMAAATPKRRPAKRKAKS